MASRCPLINASYSSARPRIFTSNGAFIERHGLQLVHNPGTRLHHAVAMPYQLPQIPVLPARHPDLRETIFQHQAQD